MFARPIYIPSPPQPLRRGFFDLNEECEDEEEEFEEMEEEE